MIFLDQKQINIHRLSVVESPAYMAVINPRQWEWIRSQQTVDIIIFQSLIIIESSNKKSTKVTQTITIQLKNERFSNRRKFQGNIKHGDASSHLYLKLWQYYLVHHDGSVLNVCSIFWDTLVTNIANQQLFTSALINDKRSNLEHSFSNIAQCTEINTRFECFVNNCSSKTPCKKKPKNILKKLEFCQN